MRKRSPDAIHLRSQLLEHERLQERAGQPRIGPEVSDLHIGQGKGEGGVGQEALGVPGESLETIALEGRERRGQMCAEQEIVVLTPGGLVDVGGVPIRWSGSA